MTAKTMAEVLRAHWSVSTHADNEPEPPVDKCDGCGKVLHTWGDQIPDVHPLTAHQAAALSAAGFGLVADAKAEALEEAANDMDSLERLSGYPEESCTDEENAEVEAYDNATDNQERLRARAAALRAVS